MKARKRGKKWQAIASYTDSRGEYKQKSFTRDTKEDAIIAATNFQKMQQDSLDGALGEMVKKYIGTNESVFSVTTVAGYKKELRCHIEPYRISAVKISAITGPKLQQWISEMAKTLKS